jgi:serine/threonine protein kinase/tetratricopeptide (TPR) repeat protein
MSDASRHLLTLFGEALDCASPEARAAYLDRVCRSDPALRARLEGLLRAHHEAGAFLRGSPPASPGATTDEPAGGERPGTVIGPYKLLQQIGEGGMGTVFMAEQTQPVQRKVAVKVIKPGMDSRQVIARFEAERQALALMDHPNIAKVLDGGTTDSGRPYFVMELVKGVPITQYCDEHQVPPKERLELFLPVCQAVQHAHQKGIIHRDLKPSNVMVCLYDGQPVPKVIDFGVAKATGPKLTERTLFTEFGAVIGTLEYMSPEQAEVNQLDIDTRSDIYSLGVLLYELLTGTTPLQGKRVKEASLLEVLRLIREEEPPRPSTRLSTTEELASIAAKRGLEPKKLSGLVRGELDWIVMKCLEKDRSRRYETANGLARDIERYLHDEPVLACPPSALYRFRKFARRNRAALSTAALVAVALIVGTVVSIRQAVRATRAEALAQVRLESEKQARQDAEAARQDAEAQRELAEENFQKACRAVDEYFTLVSESRLLDVPGLQPLRKQLLEAAQRYYQGFLQQRAQDPHLRGEVALSYVRVAQIYEQNDQADASVRALQRGLECIEVLLRDDPAGDLPRRLAGFRKGGRLGQYWYRWPSDAGAAVRVYQKAAARWEAFAQKNPEVVGFTGDLASFYRRMGDLQTLTGPRQDAAMNFQKACRLLEGLAHAQPNEAEHRADLADTLGYLGVYFSKERRYQECEANLRRALTLFERLVSSYPNTPDYRAGLAITYRRLGAALPDSRSREAEDANRRAVEIATKLQGEYPNFPSYQKMLGDTLMNWGDLLKRTGRSQEAETPYRQAVEVREKLARAFPGNEGYSVADFAHILSLLAQLLKANNRPREAERYYRQSIEVWQKLVVDFPEDRDHRAQLSLRSRELADHLKDTGRH